MYKNPFWILFLSLMAIGILFYSSRTAYHIWQYIRLDKQIEADQIHWSVISLSQEEFFPQESYEFKVKEKEYKGQSRWHERSLNEWTAQDKIKKLIQSPPLVWYDSSSPENSDLQKIFPLKEVIYTGMLWLLGLYFTGLGYYVQKRQAG